MGSIRPEPEALGEATLGAVHEEGATAADVMTYLAELGMSVRPNHLGIALQRHRRASRLENRDERWFLPRVNAPKERRRGDDDEHVGGHARRR